MGQLICKNEFGWGAYSIGELIRVFTVPSESPSKVTAGVIFRCYIAQQNIGQVSFESDDVCWPRVAPKSDRMALIEFHF